MSQIKQISKIVNNTSKEKKYINLASDRNFM